MDPRELKTLLIASAMWLGWIAFAVVMTVAYLKADDAPVLLKKQAYFVCDGKCLKSFSANEKTQLIAPLKDGKPDWSKAVLHSVVAHYDESLGRIEMR